MVNYAQGYTHMLITLFLTDLAGFFRPMPKNYQLGCQVKQPRLVKIPSFGDSVNIDHEVDHPAPPELPPWSIRGVAVMNGRK
jgi:hypothetical protein